LMSARSLLSPNFNAWHTRHASLKAAYATQQTQPT
jgi:hypothetical protein